MEFSQTIKGILLSKENPINVTNLVAGKHHQAEVTFGRYDRVPMMQCWMPLQ